MMKEEHNMRMELLQFELETKKLIRELKLHLLKNVLHREAPSDVMVRAALEDC